MLKVADTPIPPPRSAAPANASDFCTVARKPLRVLVADGDTSFVDRLETAFRYRTGLAFVGRASTGDEAFELAMSESPDMAFVGLDMPGGPQRRSASST